MSEEFTPYLFILLVVLFIILSLVFIKIKLNRRLYLHPVGNINNKLPGHMLTNKAMLIGRVHSNVPDMNMLLINSKNISRRHAVIEKRQDSYWLIDQGSINGTFVNGKRITNEVLLCIGDRICFHKDEFEFNYDLNNSSSRGLWFLFGIVPAFASIKQNVFAGERIKPDVEVENIENIGDSEVVKNATQFQPNAMANVESKEVDIDKNSISVVDIGINTNANVNEQASAKPTDNLDQNDIIDIDIDFALDSDELDDIFDLSIELEDSSIV